MVMIFLNSVEPFNGFVAQLQSLKYRVSDLDFQAKRNQLIPLCGQSSVQFCSELPFVIGLDMNHKNMYSLTSDSDYIRKGKTMPEFSQLDFLKI